MEERDWRKETSQVVIVSIYASDSGGGGGGIFVNDVVAKGMDALMVHVVLSHFVLQHYVISHFGVASSGCCWTLVKQQRVI